MSAPSQAEPSSVDPVGRFLKDSGLLNGADASGQPPAPGLLSQMREGASDLVLNAMDFLGVPYRRGGNTAETGFDCSGFTRYVFENSVGLLLPRRAQEQARTNDLQLVKAEELKPGDLVFFNTMRKAFSHVGIYVGNGQFVHAPRTGSHVRVEDMRQAYWSTRFNGARRVPGLDASALSSTLQSFTGGDDRP
ncbi:MAG: C40 family peptidase [Leptothrix sp. (in: b-proteobacteria)]